MIFAYSDVPHEYVMHKASIVLAAGADFRLMGPKSTQIKSTKPVVSVCAVRTGSGKSQTTRRVSLILRDDGLTAWPPSATPCLTATWSSRGCSASPPTADLDKHECTIEEREEYEPHLDNGVIVYAGVDYEAILRQAEQEVDIILWDGGNNDFPFYKPDLAIVVADPHRPGHEMTYHPGETNVALADVFVINKVDTANPENVITVRNNLYARQPECGDHRSRLAALRGRPGRHPRQAGAGDRRWPDPDPRRDGLRRRLGGGPPLWRSRDCRPAAICGRLDPATYQKYPKTGPILPAMGYGDEMIHDLEKTIDQCGCRPGDHRHADRPDPRHQDQQTHRSACATSCRRSASPPWKIF